MPPDREAPGALPEKRERSPRCWRGASCRPELSCQWRRRPAPHWEQIRPVSALLTPQPSRDEAEREQTS